MAKKYIDQTVIIKMAKPYWQTDEDGFDVEWLFDKEPIIFKRDVEAIPAADVVEVRHAHWIDTGSGQECSLCKEIQYGYDSGRYYCANCGARMESE